MNTTPTTKATNEMVDRFLSWKLPEDFSPDCGIHFIRIPLAHPTGTNLLNAGQARAMLEHVLAESQLQRWPAPLEHMDDAETPEQAWEFWKDVLCNADGSINMEQLKLELCDFSMLARYYERVLCHVTGGAVSKWNTHPSAVCAVFDDYLTESINEAVKEATDDDEQDASDTGAGLVEAINQVMEQAQVFASAWALVGGVFDQGNAMDDADEAKAELRTMVASLARAAPTLKATIAQPEQATSPHTFGTKKRSLLEGWIDVDKAPADGQQVETLWCWGFNSWAIHLGTAQYKVLVAGHGGYHGAVTGRPQDTPSYWRPLEGETAPSVGVPDGYVPAPTKPSAVQLKAARDAYLKKNPPAKGSTWTMSFGYEDIKVMYEAMLASAQPQQKEG